MGFGVSKREDVYEARGMLLLLPDLLPQSARLVLAHVGNELENCAETALQGLRTYFMARQLMDLSLAAKLGGHPLFLLRPYTAHLAVYVPQTPGPKPTPTDRHDAATPPESGI